MRTSLPVPALRQAREHLLEHGDCLAGALDERIARSWRRSLDAGLSPGGRAPDAAHAGAGDLSQLLACNHELLSHSRPVMEHLFEQVRHSRSMVVLADKLGTLMHTLGDADFLCKAERVALAPGAPWHERHRGTNAIGTALAEASAMLDPHEECIDWQHLPDDLAEELLVAAPQGAEAAMPAAPQRITENLKELSRAAVRQALEGSRGNISAAARRLGISRQTLYRKLND